MGSDTGYSQDRSACFRRTGLECYCPDSALLSPLKTSPESSVSEGVRKRFLPIWRPDCADRTLLVYIIIFWGNRGNNKKGLGLSCGTKYAYKRQSVHFHHYKNRDCLCPREICQRKQRWFSEMYTMHLWGGGVLSESVVHCTKGPLVQTWDWRVAETDTRDGIRDIFAD